MAIRWRWPPENSCGYFWAKRGARPTRCITSATRPATSERGQILWTRSGSARVAKTVIRGLREA